MCLTKEICSTTTLSDPDQPFEHVPDPTAVCADGDVACTHEEEMKMKKITGMGHLAIKVRDVDRSLAFYSGVLKFPEMLRLHHDDGSLFLIYLRITEDQYLEIFPGAVTDKAPGVDANGANHFCLTVEQLEPVLAEIGPDAGCFAQWVTTESGSQLVKAAEPTIGNGLDGNRQAWLIDPDGNRIELMEMAPDCLQYKALERLRAEVA